MKLNCVMLNLCCFKIEPMDNQMFTGTMWMQLLHLIHQFLKEQNCIPSLHQFERDYALYFDMEYFKELINRGEWEELEHYLTGFTSVQSNDASRGLFFQIMKQKYLEALDRGELEDARSILYDDLSVIMGSHHPVFHQLRSLQFSADFRKVPDLRAWVDVPTSRNIMVEQLPKMVRANPDLNGKLVLPHVPGRLVDIAIQSLELQYSKCDCPRDGMSILKDHQCPGQSAPAPPADETPMQDLNPPDSRPAPRSAARQVDQTSSRPRRHPASVASPAHPGGASPRRSSAEVTRNDASARQTSGTGSPARPLPNASTTSLPLVGTSSGPTLQPQSSAISVHAGGAASRPCSAGKTSGRASGSRSPTAARANGNTLSLLQESRTSPRSNPDRPAAARRAGKSSGSRLLALPVPPEGASSDVVSSSSLSRAITCSLSVPAPNNLEAGPSSARGGGRSHKRKIVHIEQEHPPMDSMLSLEAGPSAPAPQPWVLLNSPSQVKTLVLPEILVAERVCKLMYTGSGKRLIALTESSEHCIWQWKHPASFWEVPKLIIPSETIKFINDPVAEGAVTEPSHSFTLINQSSIMISASIGKVICYDMVHLEKLSGDIENLATSLASSPPSTNWLAIGTDDSRIVILRVRGRVLKFKRSFGETHAGRVTGLMFAESGNMLVSAGSDNKLILWDLRKWRKEESADLPIPEGLPVIRKDIRIELHKNGDQFLAVHESLLALFDVLTLQLLIKWNLPPGCGALTGGTFSCNSKQVFAGAEDGSIWLFYAPTLMPQFRLSPQTYQTSAILENHKLVYPNAIASHPTFRNQVAVGLSDGHVILIERVIEEEREDAELLVYLKDSINLKITTS